MLKNSLLPQFFIAKDQQVVDGFSDLLSKTEERETKINMITKRLDEELVYLSKFLENLATRRPVRMYLCYFISCSLYILEPLIRNFNDNNFQLSLYPLLYVYLFLWD